MHEKWDEVKELFTLALEPALKTEAVFFASSLQHCDECAV